MVNNNQYQHQPRHTPLVPPVVPPSVTCRLHRVHARANPEQNINPYRVSASKLLADPVSKDFKTTSSLEDCPSRIHYPRRAPLVPWITAALYKTVCDIFIIYKMCGRPVLKLLAFPISKTEHIIDKALAACIYITRCAVKSNDADQSRCPGIPTRYTCHV